MKEKVSVLIPEEELTAKIRELGETVSREFEGEDIVIVCVLKGAVFFATELAKRITVPVTMDFMIASSYGSSTISSGEVVISKDLDTDIAGRNVVIAEDIIDTGNTLSKLKRVFENRGAKTVKVCAMLDKPDRRTAPITGDYVGFSIPDKFVVGYGLDYDQKYRNLPYIGVVEFEED